MFQYRIPEAGAGYVPETKIKCYWEIAIVGKRVLLIQRGGPLEPVALEISVSGPGELEVTDCWDWGE